MAMKRTRRKFSAAFKAQVALEAIKERETLAELGHRFGLHSNVISKWKQEFLSHAAEVFVGPADKSQAEAPLDAEQLYAKIGKLEMENEFLKKSCYKAGLSLSGERW